MPPPPPRHIQVSLTLPGGVGVSLVDSTPPSEELVYISLRDIQVEYSLSRAEQILRADVKNFQVTLLPWLYSTI